MNEYEPHQEVIFWRNRYAEIKKELERVTRELDQIKTNIVRLADRYKPIEPDGGWTPDGTRVQR